MAEDALLITVRDTKPDPKEGRARATEVSFLLPVRHLLETSPVSRTEET